MVTTVGPNCGIAAYSQELVRNLDALVILTVHPITPGRQPVEHYRAQAESLNEADVIHIQHEHSFWGGILPGHSAFWEFRYLLKKPVVITVHTTTSLAAMLRLKEERRPHIKMAKIYLTMKKRYRDSVEIAPFVTGRAIVHTEEGRRQLIERGASPQYVHMIPAGVPDPLPADSQGRAFREKFGLAQRRLITLFGYTANTKGYEVVLDALPQIPADVAFVIAGGPRNPDQEEYIKALMNQVAARGLQERVIYTGYLSEPEIAEAMSASEIVLAPHTLATGSYSVMIPLTYGKPVIASDLAIFREIKERGGGVQLFANRDFEALARAVDSLLEDETCRSELAERALAYARSHSWPEIARRTVEVYRLAISDARERMRVS
jgi:glycosyltransferase involved in cell wall biosynthesis